VAGSLQNFYNMIYCYISCASEWQISPFASIKFINGSSTYWSYRTKFTDVKNETKLSAPFSWPLKSRQYVKNNYFFMST